MRQILTITIIVFFSSCSTKYNGSHKDYKKFSEDIKYCLKKACINKPNKILYNISFISSALAYGGGGGGGSSQQQDKISYKIFNICMNKKGYIKDENGIFELPNLTCSYENY